MTTIHPKVLSLMNQYQAETAPYWQQYLSALSTKDDDAYKRFVEQTEPARKKWEQKVKELKKQGVIH